MTKRILRVNSVELQVLKSNPPVLVVSAIGTVPTTGWHGPQLVPFIYIAPPADGIYDFDFVAEPPSGLAGDVVLPILGAYTWHDYPKDLKGVRIHAASNAKEKLVSDAKEMRFSPID